jgi:AbrB family looped-hinge helix DNA binding protein
MLTATLTSKGQTTIPREVREFLTLNPGDRLEFTLSPDDKTVILRAVNVKSLQLRGFLKRPGMKRHNLNERVVAHIKRAHLK